MDELLKDCPCSGKGMSTLAAPWILLHLYSRERMHGYEIKKHLLAHLEELGLGVNITGVYRHLKQLEDRGMVVSEWETPEKGSARKVYRLNASGKNCLWQWMNTLSVKRELIDIFLDHARKVCADKSEAC